MNSSMSQKKNLIKPIIVIPYFRWNAQRKAFGTNAQPRIARYGSSRGLGIPPTRKIPMQPGKPHRYFCLCIYKGPARQFALGKTTFDLSPVGDNCTLTSFAIELTIIHRQLWTLWCNEEKQWQNIYQYVKLLKSGEYQNADYKFYALKVEFPVQVEWIRYGLFLQMPKSGRRQDKEWKI